MVYLRAATFFPFASLILGYKTIRLFFPEKIAFWATLIWAIEPFWAWQNFQLASENLYMPIFLAAMFCLFSFLKRKGSVKIYCVSFHPSWPSCFDKTDRAL